MKNPFSLIPFLCFIFLLSPTKAQQSLDKQVLMQVGGEKVTVKEFMDVFTKNNVQNELIDKKSIDEYLELFINYKLKVREAKALKLDTASTFLSELAGYRQQLAKPYFTDPEVTELLVREAYERMQTDIRASHILIMVDKNAPPEDTLKAWNRAMDLRNKALSGADFGQLAAEFSDDPSARDREAIPNQRSFRPGNKGDLGFFNVFDMVYPFESGAYNTPLNQVSMPLRSDFGYHLIKVTGRTPASGQIEAAHIYFSVNPEASEDEVKEKKQKADYVYNKILEGMSFEEAVREYSEDRGSAMRDGMLAKFAVNRIVPEFVAAVKNMQPGEVSAPVRTIYGWHIIKLHGMEKPGTFEEEAPRLRERVSRDNRAQLSEEAVIRRIKAEAGYKLNDKNLNHFIASLDSTISLGSFSAKPFMDSKTPLFKLGKSQFTIAHLAKYMEDAQMPQQNIRPDVYGTQLFNEFLTKTVMDYEDARLEQRYPEFAALMKEYHDGILLFELMDRMVWTKAVKDTLGLQAFYDENKHNYMWKDRVAATVVTVTSADEVAAAEKIVREAAGEEALRLALQESELKSVRIQPGKFEEGDNRYVDQTAREIGAIGRFESEADRHTVFVRINELLPAQPKALDEARGIITSDYQNHLEKLWVTELRAKYPLKINKKVLSQLKARY
ncbi:MAG TPA: peptidylprolyl isomerase [Bacteroidales bacterium]|nr:peptidylprolyl isomerase [Bacteroidales bacterium]